MTRNRSGLGPIPIPPALMGLYGTVQGGDLPVGDASSGRFQRLAKGANNTSLRVGGTGTLAYLRDRYANGVDLGFLAESFPLRIHGSVASIGVAGVTAVNGLFFPEPMLVSNLHCCVHAAGTSLTANQCGAAFYQNGNLLGSVTSGIHNELQSTGVRTAPIAPVSVAAGLAYVVWWANGSGSGPQLVRGNASGTTTSANGLIPSAFLHATGSTNTTTAPASLGTLTASIYSFWVGVS